jgi:hypothetical protein
MSIRPIDREEFFRSLGAKRVQKGVINRELTGDDLSAAQTWLEWRRANQGMRLTLWGIALASMIGLVAAAASYMAP